MMIKNIMSLNLFKNAGIKIQSIGFLYFLLYFSLSSKAQYSENPLRKVYIDEGIFPTCVKGSASLETLLEKGYRGFIFRSENTLNENDIRYF